MDELSEDKITSSMIKEFENDIDKLFSKIRSLNSNQVIVISLYTILVLKLLHINASDRMMERMNLFRGMHKGSFEALFCWMKVLYRWILFQNKRYHIFDQAALYKVLKEMERYTLSVNV